jgi:hypothetical protein
MLTRRCGSYAIAGLAATACCCGPGHALAQDVVRDGKPVAEVVVPADAPSAEAFAAKDLCHWIREITGAEVPLVAQPSPASNTKLCIGKQLAAPWKTEPAELKGTDGFAMRRKDSSVFIFGDRPRGTLYGVYALLEENTDIIWARPAADFGTVFGRTPNLTLTKTDVLEKPVFRLRGWNICSLRNDRNTGVWCMRNRINLPIQTPVSELDPLRRARGRCDSTPNTPSRPRAATGTGRPEPCATMARKWGRFVTTVCGSSSATGPR